MPSVMPSTTELKEYVRHKLQGADADERRVEAIVQAIRKRLQAMSDSKLGGGIERGLVSRTHWTPRTGRSQDAERRSEPSRSAWPSRMRSVIDEVVERFAEDVATDDVEARRAPLTIRRDRPAAPVVEDEVWAEARRAERRLDTAPTPDFDLVVDDDDLSLLGREDAV